MYIWTGGQLVQERLVSGESENHQLICKAPKSHWKLRGVFFKYIISQAPCVINWSGESWRNRLARGMLQFAIVTLLDNGFSSPFCLAKTSNDIVPLRHINLVTQYGPAFWQSYEGVPWVWILWWIETSLRLEGLRGQPIQQTWGSNKQGPHTDFISWSPSVFSFLFLLPAICPPHPTPAHKDTCTDKCHQHRRQGRVWGNCSFSCIGESLCHLGLSLL